MNDKLGKEAEEKIKQWLDRKDDGYAFYRLYDIMTGYYGQYNISDFICYKYPNQWFLESKATWEDRFDINMISETQYEGLMKMSDIPGVFACVVVLFASYQRAFIIDIREIDRYKKESGMKSFNIKKIDQWPFKYSEIQTIPNNRKKLLDYTGELDDHINNLIDKSSRCQSFVGIWWYTDEGRVIGAMCDVNDGYLDGRYIQYSQLKNHMNIWKYIVYHEFEKETADKIYELGYRCLERGRVIYDTMTQLFIITCSEAIASNTEALSNIKDAFSLSGSRCEVEILSHYKKLPLTGNLAVDEQILNMDV